MQPVFRPLRSLRARARLASQILLAAAAFLAAATFLAACVSSLPNPAAPAGVDPALTAPGQFTPTLDAAAGGTTLMQAKTPAETLAGPTLTPGTTAAEITYDFQLTLNLASHQAQVSEVVRYAAFPAGAGEELLLVVPPNSTPGVFHLASLRWGGDESEAAYTLDGVVLKTRLPSPGAAGSAAARALELRLRYALSLPPREDPLGYTPRQTNLCDWYPYVPPYRADRGWLVNPPGPVGEYTLPAAGDYRVALTLQDAPADLVVAASASATKADAAYTYTHAGARSFSLSFSPEYIIQTQSGSGFDVSVYAFPEHAAAARASAQASLQALTLYSRLFSPYPHAHLAVVESLFRDGMEYDGLYFLGWEYFEAFDGSLQNYLTALSAHETAHQWWYASVGSDPAGEPWLDEALATYSELLYYENTQPDLVNWWWDFRVFWYDPGGMLNSPTSAFSAFRPYVNAVYLRGALYLRDLRALLGDAQWFALLHAYAAAGRGKWVTADDFSRLISGDSDPKFAPLKSEYFR